MSAIAIPSEVDALVGMGQIALLATPQVGRAVLGSCVGVALYDERKKVAAFAHVVLPESSGRDGTPGKFADTSIKWMVEELVKRGAERRKLSAKLAGGANMFSSTGPFQIGKQNAEAVRRALGEFGVRLGPEHLGGTHGRRVTFDCRTFQLMIEIVGQPTQVI